MIITIPIHTGQNLITIPYNMDGLSFSEIFQHYDVSPITGIIGTGTAALYFNGTWVGSIEGLEPGLGYWFMSNIDGELELEVNGPAAPNRLVELGNTNLQLINPIISHDHVNLSMSEVFGEWCTHGVISSIIGEGTAAACFNGILVGTFQTITPYTGMWLEFTVNNPRIDLTGPNEFFEYLPLNESNIPVIDWSFYTGIGEVDVDIPVDVDPCNGQNQNDCDDGYIEGCYYDWTQNECVSVPHEYHETDTGLCQSIHTDHGGISESDTGGVMYFNDEQQTWIGMVDEDVGVGSYSENVNYRFESNSPRDYSRRVICNDGFTQTYYCHSSEASSVDFVGSGGNSYDGNYFIDASNIPGCEDCIWVEDGNEYECFPFHGLPNGEAKYGISASDICSGNDGSQSGPNTGGYDMCRAISEGYHLLFTSGAYIYESEYVAAQDLCDWDNPQPAASSNNFSSNVWWGIYGNCRLQSSLPSLTTDGFNCCQLSGRLANDLPDPFGYLFNDHSQLERDTCHLLPSCRPGGDPEGDTFFCIPTRAHGDPDTWTQIYGQLEDPFNTRHCNYNEDSPEDADNKGPWYIALYNAYGQTTRSLLDCENNWASYIDDYDGYTNAWNENCGEITFVNQEGLTMFFDGEDICGILNDGSSCLEVGFNPNNEATNYTKISVFRTLEACEELLYSYTADVWNGDPVECVMILDENGNNTYGGFGVDDILSNLGTLYEPPVVTTDITLSTDINTSVNFTPTCTDIDTPDSQLTYIIQPPVYGGGAGATFEEFRYGDVTPPPFGQHMGSTTFTYTPDPTSSYWTNYPDLFQRTEEFTFTCSDGNSTATGNISVTVNRPPDSVDFSINVAEDTPTTFNIGEMGCAGSGVCTCPDGGQDCWVESIGLGYETCSECSEAECDQQMACEGCVWNGWNTVEIRYTGGAKPENGGSVKLNGTEYPHNGSWFEAPWDSELEYEASDNYVGADVIEFRCGDTQNLISSTANVNITVSSVNDGPIVVHPPKCANEETGHPGIMGENCDGVNAVAMPAGNDGAPHFKLLQGSPSDITITHDSPNALACVENAWETNQNLGDVTLTIEDNVDSLNSGILTVTTELGAVDNDGKLEFYSQPNWPNYQWTTGNYTYPEYRHRFTTTITGHQNAPIGVYPMTMTCTDSAGLTANYGVNFIVLPSYVIDEPTTDTLGITSITLNEDTTTSFDVECLDVQEGVQNLPINSSAQHGTLDYVWGVQTTIDLGYDENGVQQFLYSQPITVTYEPDENYSGSDLISLACYNLQNSTVDSTPATISVTVNSVNDPPSITLFPPTEQDLYTGTPLEGYFMCSDVEGLASSFPRISISPMWPAQGGFGITWSANDGTNPYRNAILETIDGNDYYEALPLGLGDFGTCNSASTNIPPCPDEPFDVSVVPIPLADASQTDLSLGPNSGNFLSLIENHLGYIYIEQDPYEVVFPGDVKQYKYHVILNDNALPGDQIKLSVQCVDDAVAGGDNVSYRYSPAAVLEFNVAIGDNRPTIHENLFLGSEASDVPENPAYYPEVKEGIPKFYWIRAEDVDQDIQEMDAWRNTYPLQGGVHVLGEIELIGSPVQDAKNEGEPTHFYQKIKISTISNEEGDIPATFGASATDSQNNTESHTFEITIRYVNNPPHDLVQSPNKDCEHMNPYDAETTEAYCTDPCIWNTYTESCKCRTGDSDTSCPDVILVSENVIGADQGGRVWGVDPTHNGTRGVVDLIKYASRVSDGGTPDDPDSDNARLEVYYWDGDTLHNYHDGIGTDGNIVFSNYNNTDTGAHCQDLLVDGNVWHDGHSSGEHNCIWYANYGTVANGRTACQEWGANVYSGDASHHGNLTANEACCTCGGGEIRPGYTILEEHQFWIASDRENVPPPSSFNSSTDAVSEGTITLRVCDDKLFINNSTGEQSCSGTNVVDGIDGCCNQPFDIGVYSTYVAEAPILVEDGLPDIVFDEGGTSSGVDFSDALIGDVGSTIEWFFSPPPNNKICYESEDASDNSPTFFPCEGYEDFNGTEVWTLQASSNTGFDSNTIDFNITIQPVNDPPGPFDFFTYELVEIDNVNKTITMREDNQPSLYLGPGCSSLTETDCETFYPDATNACVWDADTSLCELQSPGGSVQYSSFFIDKESAINQLSYEITSSDESLLTAAYEPTTGPAITLFSQPHMYGEVTLTITITDSGDPPDYTANNELSTTYTWTVTIEPRIDMAYYHNAENQVFGPITQAETTLFSSSNNLDSSLGAFGCKSYDPITKFRFKYFGPGILSINGFEYTPSNMDDAGWVEVPVDNTSNELNVTDYFYSIGFDVEYTPAGFYGGMDEFIWTCTTGDVPNTGTEGETEDWASKTGPNDTSNNETITTKIEVEYREVDLNFGYGSSVTIEQSIFNSHDPMSGMSIIEVTDVNTQLENTEQSIDIFDIDKRPSLGVFYYDNDNPLRNDFTKNLPAPFTQIVKPNLLENGNGRMVKYRNDDTVNNPFAATAPVGGTTAYIPRAWDYINMSGVAAVSCQDITNEGDCHSPCEWESTECVCTISGGNDALCYIAGGDYHQNFIQDSSAFDDALMYAGYLNYTVPTFNNIGQAWGTYRFARWRESTECYSYGKCLEFDNHHGTAEKEDAYRQINQYQQINTEDILPFSSLKIKFMMKTTARQGNGEMPYVEAGVKVGGDPGRYYYNGQWEHPDGNDEIEANNGGYIDIQGYYNSIIGGTWNWFAGGGRFKNTTLDKWEQFEYTFNLSSRHINYQTAELHNLWFLIQWGSQVEGKIYLDDFSVTEGYDFTPDADIRMKKGENEYGTGLLTEYYDPYIQNQLEKYNDTIAPLEAAFYFYPRYNYNDIFNVDKQIIYNDFRNEMFYLYDVDWGDGSPNEFINEPKKLGDNIMVHHTYETSGIYEVKGTMLRMKPDTDYNPLGIIFNQRFTLRININEGLDEDFRYFGSDGFSFIPYKNTLPIIGGYNEQSIYYKSTKRQLGFISNNITTPTSFEKISDKLKTEIALQKMHSDFNFNILPEFQKQRYLQSPGFTFVPLEFQLNKPVTITTAQSSTAGWYIEGGDQSNITVNESFTPKYFEDGTYGVNVRWELEAPSNWDAAVENSSWLFVGYNATEFEDLLSPCNHDGTSCTGGTEFIWKFDIRFNEISDNGPQLHFRTGNITNDYPNPTTQRYMCVNNSDNSVTDIYCNITEVPDAEGNFEQGCTDDNNASTFCCEPDQTCTELPPLAYGGGGVRKAWSRNIQQTNISNGSQWESVEYTRTLVSDYSIYTTGWAGTNGYNDYPKFPNFEFLTENSSTYVNDTDTRPVVIDFDLRNMVLTTKERYDLFEGSITANVDNSSSLINNQNWNIKMWDVEQASFYNFDNIDTLGSPTRETTTSWTNLNSDTYGTYLSAIESLFDDLTGDQDNFVAHLTTYIEVGTDFSVDTAFGSDNYGYLYINDTLINTTYANWDSPQDYEYDFIAGQQYKIDMIYTELSSGDYVYLGFSLLRDEIIAGGTTEFNIFNEVNTGKLYGDTKDELGSSIGDADITNIRYFNEPKQMYEMLGFIDIEGGIPNNPRYWKNIIPEGTSHMDRNGITIDDNGIYNIDTSVEQYWISGHYYPVLPNYNKFGLFNYDYELDSYDYTNNNIPFPLEGPITDEELNDSSLKINITSNQIESNVLDDSSGNQNYGFAFSDYKPNFDGQTLEPKKIKNTDRIRSSKNNGAF